MKKAIAISTSLIALLLIQTRVAQAFTPDSKAEKIDWQRYCAGLALAFDRTQYPVICAIDKNSKAGRAGLKVGDRVIAIDDRIAAFMGEDQWRAALAQTSDRAISLEIERGDGGSKTVRVEPIRAADFSDINLAKNVATTRLAYPVKTAPLKAGFYPIDLPPFLREQASLSPLVLEIYQSSAGPDPALEYSIRKLNNQLKADDEPLIALISLDLSDRDTEPLREHFRIKSAPSYIFVGSDSAVIKDYVDVARHKLSADELSERLTEMIQLKDQALNMVPVLMPQVAQHWRELTNSELQQSDSK